MVPMILLLLVGVASAYRFPCIGHGACTCDTEEQLIDCLNKGLKAFPWFGDAHLAGFRRLSLVGNDLASHFPDEHYLLQTIPDLEMIDFTGNRRLNCRELARTYREIEVLSDCPGHRRSHHIADVYDPKTTEEPKRDWSMPTVAADSELHNVRSTERPCHIFCKVDRELNKQVKPGVVKAIGHVTGAFETIKEEGAKIPQKAADFFRTIGKIFGA